MTDDNPVRNLVDVEERVRTYWDDINLLDRLEEQNEDGEPYFLLDGPPFANNEPHIGHFRNTVYKDVYIRYAQLQGKDTLFKPGFDTHGLPVENMVQQEHGLKTKEDIEELGEEAFMDLCRDHATTYIEEFRSSYRLLGSWYGWREPYVTYENNYIESVWNTFKTIYDKGLVYRGKKPVYWCPVDQTTMAGYEVTDSYETVEDPMVIVKFDLKERDASLIAYTTTPWTLPSNAFLSVHPDETYVEVDTERGTLILAEERLSVLDDIDLAYEVIDSYPGEDLVDLEYEPIIDCSVQRELATDDNAHKVYESIELLKERVSSGTAEKKDEEAKDVYEHFVTVDSGTGIVHCAPGHGQSDYEVGTHYDIPLISPLNDACEYTEGVEPYQGMFVKDADDHIVDDLRDSGALIHTERIQHEYPVSWRSEAPLIFRLSDQWFFDVQSVKDDMLAHNEDVEWQPSFAKKRFKHWVEDAEDWNFTRQRYWGVPVPLFVNEDDPEDVIVVGSEEELRDMVDQDVDDELDLHVIDDYTITRDGVTYKPLGDVFDVWFDSGSVPYGSMHYPFENKADFEEHFPVSRINEAQDQIRGWFYSLMYVATAAHGTKPYETVSMPGWVMDKNGDKLSKSKGNFEPVPDLVDDHGADNIRFYYCWDTDPGKEMKFNADTIDSESSEALSTLWHLTRYVIGNLDEPQSIDALDLEDEDMWVLSKAHSATSTVESGFEDFQIDEAGRGLYDFIVKDVSRHYVQLIRERSRTDNTPYHVLYHLIKHAAKLLAPITPHFSEHVYQELSEAYGDAKDSVHLTRIPTVTTPFQAYHDDELETLMNKAHEVIRSGLAARDRLGRSIRRPIESLVVTVDDTTVEAAVKELGDVIARRVNAESVMIDDVHAPSVAEPRYKAIGADHQENTQDVATIIQENPEALRDGEGTIPLGEYEISPDYYTLSYAQPDTGAMGFGDGFRVYLDDDQPKRLEQRGLMREVLRRVQVLRRDNDLDKADRIVLGIDADRELRDAINAYEDVFKDRAGIDELVTEDIDEEAVVIDGYDLRLSIRDVRR